MPRTSGNKRGRASRSSCTYPHNERATAPTPMILPSQSTSPRTLAQARLMRSENPQDPEHAKTPPSSLAYGLVVPVPGFGARAPAP